MRNERSWAGFTARYGAAGEHGAWKVVMDHYYWDRLKEAFRAAEGLGTGTAAHGIVNYRMIEGEFMTRERGQMHTATDWLTIETIPEQTIEPMQALQERVVDAADAIARRFGYEHGPPVLLSVLAEEANVPWMPGRHGYCIEKFPYDKICVPSYSLKEHDDLEHVVQHEYAHVVCLNLSQGLCPHWLDEAIAMVAGGGVERRAWRALAAGREQWLGPEELNSAYRRDREDEAQRRDVWLAYQQSAALGFYLASIKGEGALGDLLRAFSNNSVMQDLVMRVKGEAPSDEALNEVYGFGTRALFKEGFSWLKGLGSA